MYTHTTSAYGDGSIAPSSTQWKYSEFRLQMILSHPNIEILSITKNDQARYHFEGKQDYFKIQASVDVTQSTLDEIAHLKNNHTKGQLFKCGRLEQDCKYYDGIGNQKVYRMLMCKIAVKDIFPIYKTGIFRKEDLLTFTDDYDSIYLSNKKQQMIVYDHQYMLKSSSQYVWEYDIQYKYCDQSQGKAKKWVADQYRCDECQDRQANWYCINQKQLFCSSCYQETHKGKNRKNHKRQSTSPFNCYKKCSRATHAGKMLDYYCLDCKQMKCQKCLQDSAHTDRNGAYNSGSSYSYNLSHNHNHKSFKQSGEIHNSKANIHVTIPVRELFIQFKNNQNEKNSEIKLKLTTKIKQIQEIIALLSNNFQQKLQHLEHQFKQQMKAIKLESIKQVNKAVTVHTELKRKYDELLWMQKFVEYNQEVLDAESNVHLKESFASYRAFMNAAQYFQKINRKIEDLQKLFTWQSD